MHGLVAVFFERYETIEMLMNPLKRIHNTFGFDLWVDGTLCFSGGKVIEKNPLSPKPVEEKGVHVPYSDASAIHDGWLVTDWRHHKKAKRVDNRLWLMRRKSQKTMVCRTIIPLLGDVKSKRYARREKGEVMCSKLRN